MHSDVVPDSGLQAHADELLDVAPKILAALHVSLNKTIQKTTNPRAPICIPSNADPSPAGSPAGGCLGDFRGYNELMYTGVLTYEQADNMFIHLTYGNESQLVTRPMTLGATGCRSPPLSDHNTPNGFKVTS